MQSLLKAVQSGDRATLQQVISQIPDSLRPTEEDLLAVIDTMPLIVKQYTEPFSFELEGKQNTWYQYESLIWSLGESFRQILLKNRDLRRKPALFSAIENVAMNVTFGKGRESFVMLLGKYGASDWVPVLRKLLMDSDVCGHAVYAHRLLAAPEAEDDIRPFLESPRTWIRNEAKRYYKKVERLQGK